jgi:hypothetical protein
MMSGRGHSRIRLLLLVVAVAGPVALAPGAARAGAGGSTCIVRITRYHFDPDTVPEEGQTSLRTRIANCTDRAITVTLTQFGAEPSPCPVIDPVGRSVQLSPAGTYRDTQGIIAASCPGDEHMTLRVTGPGGRRLAERTAHLTVTTTLPTRRRACRSAAPSASFASAATPGT